MRMHRSHELSQDNGSVLICFHVILFIEHSAYNTIFTRWSNVPV